MEMGLRARLGEGLCRVFVPGVHTAAKELWHPAFESHSIRCAGALGGPQCPIQAGGIELHLHGIGVDYL